MAGVPIVPAPVHGEARAGRPFRLTRTTRVVVGDDPDAVATGVLLAQRIGDLFDAAVEVVPGDEGGLGSVVLRLVTDPARLPVPATLSPELAVEAYRLEVDADSVVVTALDTRGLLRGLAALEQLVVLREGEASVPPVLVVDHPRFAWRGLSLDVARHFFGPEVLRDVVGVLFTLRMNTLHLHLSDDQGWRIEIPSRPDLTRVSGATAVDADPGGYLTLADYQSVVTYAAARGITVVPEIDLPGHVNAAQHAYGSLTPTGEPNPVYTGTAVGFSRLHAELPDTIPFVTDVLGDLAAATPGPFLHIGGDEALTMHAAEYDRLVGHAAGVVARAGKRVVAWQEAARAPLPPGSHLQYWDDRENAGTLAAAAAAGARIVLSPASRVYLDMKYDAETPAGGDWAGYISLRHAYDWEPADALPVPVDRIAGVEAAVWTENIRTARELYMLLLPRLAAVAELAWSLPERRDWAGFRARMRHLGPRWDALGLPWYQEALEEAPIGEPNAP